MKRIPIGITQSSKKIIQNTCQLKQKTHSLQIVLIKSVITAVLIGIITGWLRYWIGYYVLIQGIVAGLLLSWLAKKIAADKQEGLSNIRFTMAILLFFSFMVAQAIGFGLAQPVFDPFNWVARVWDGQTTESFFGIFSTGGVAHETFSEGLSGVFWILLWLFDLLFMFFFILISLPLITSKKRS